MRRTILFLVLVLALAATGTVPTAEAQPTPAQPTPARPSPVPVAVDSTVEREAQAGRQVPVIVELDSDSGDPQPLRSATDRAHGSPEIRRRTERLAASLPPDQVAGATPLADLPLLSATVGAGGLDALRHTDGVTRVVPNQRRHVDLAQSVPRIGAPTAWSLGDTGTGQAIAVLDTGVDSTHAFLAGKVVAEACFTSSLAGTTATCPGPDPTQSTATGAAVPCSATACYHGTHVAGIAAGGTGGSFSGVAPGASIIAVQIFSTYFSAADCSPAAAPCITAWDSDIVRALDYIDGLRATVDIASVNLSIGGDPTTPGCANEPEMPAIASLRAAGVATVVASGNGGHKSAIDAPACIPGAISVGATSDLTDTVTSFSNSIPDLSLLAPGSVITSSVPNGTAGASTCPAPFAASSCLGAQGTSMATPHAAGAFAILRQARPTYTVTDELDLLRSTGLPVIDASNSVSTPRLKVDAAVRPPTYHALPPARLLDTRDGGAIPLGASGTLKLAVTGRGGVPATGVSAVVLNVTSVNPSQVSFVTVWPYGAERPLASNLNLEPGTTRANLVTTGLGQGGFVSLYNNSGATHLVVDVAGWYDDGGTHDTGSHLRPVGPTRLFDTRDGTGGVPTAPVGPGGTLTVNPTTACGTTGVTAVALNITALDATTATHVTAWPSDQPKPLASNLNLVPGPPVPNLAMVTVSPDGLVSLANNAGSIDLLADLAGCFDGAAVPGRFVPVTPSRLLDTRDGTGTSGTQPVAPAGSLDVQITGRGGVPSTGVSAVVLNVTATQPTSATHLTLWAAGQSRPLASNLNVATGQTAPNLVVVPVGANGRVSVFNNEGTTHVLADVAGWYTT